MGSSISRWAEHVIVTFYWGSGYFLSISYYLDFLVVVVQSPYYYSIQNITLSYTLLILRINVSLSGPFFSLLFIISGTFTSRWISFPSTATKTSPIRTVSLNLHLESIPYIWGHGVSFILKLSDGEKIIGHFKRIPNFAFESSENGTSTSNN